MDVLISEADISAIRLVKQANHPAAPAASSGLLYLLDTDTPYIKLDDNTTIDLLAGGGSPPDPCQVRVTRASNLAATASVWTLLEFTTEVINSGAWNNASSTFTAPSDGWYLCDIHVHVGGATNKAGLQLWKNGNVFYERTPLNLDIAPMHHIDQFLVYLLQNETVKFYGYQTAQSVFTGDATWPMELQIWRL